MLKDEKGKDKTDTSGNLAIKQITLTDIMDITYKDYKVYKPSRLPTLKPDKIGTLEGDMTPTQAKHFFERYDLLIHQPNTESGFSATLSQSKESKEYTLAIIRIESKKVAIQMNMAI